MRPLTRWAATAAFAALLAGPAVAAAATPARAATGPPDIVSGIWYGRYAVNTDPRWTHMNMPALGARATVTVPHVNCAKSVGRALYEATQWAGVGGMAGTAGVAERPDAGLFQVGVIEACASKKSQPVDYLFWEMVPSSLQKAAHDADHTHPFMQPGHKETDGARYYVHVLEGQSIELTVYSPNFTTGEEPTQHPGWWYLAAKVGNARPVYTFKPAPAHTSAGRTAEAMGEWLHGIPGLAKTDPHASFRHAYAIMQGTKPELKALDGKASMLHGVPDSNNLLKAFAWGWASHSWSTRWPSMPAGFKDAFDIGTVGFTRPV